VIQEASQKGMLKFVTLTWRPMRKQDPNVVRDMGKALNKLLHRKAYKSWFGILATVECKKTKSGMFYYHIHMLVKGLFVKQAQISKDWKACSRFPIVWAKAVTRTPRRALKYVLKYVLKGFAFKSAKDKEDFKASMKGVRYVRSYGDFYNLMYKTGKHVYFPCPCCGAVKSWMLYDLGSFVDQGISNGEYMEGWDPP
jgi:hypothetical protein